jgi:predicted nuclease with TOPRIM domain
MASSNPPQFVPPNPSSGRDLADLSAENARLKSEPEIEFLKEIQGLRSEIEELRGEIKQLRGELSAMNNG